MTTTQGNELRLQIKGRYDDVNDDHIYEITRKLIKKLKEADIESRAPGGQSPQPGTAGVKGGDVVTFGMLLIAVLPTILPKVIDLLTALATDKKDLIEITLQAYEGRSINIKIPPNAKSEAIVERIIKMANEAINEMSDPACPPHQQQEQQNTDKKE